MRTCTKRYATQKPPSSPTSDRSNGTHMSIFIHICQRAQRRTRSAHRITQNCAVVCAQHCAHRESKDHCCVDVCVWDYLVGQSVALLCYLYRCCAAGCCSRKDARLHSATPPQSQSTKTCACTRRHVARCVVVQSSAPASNPLRMRSSLHRQTTSSVFSAHAVCLLYIHSNMHHTQLRWRARHSLCQSPATQIL